MQGNVRTSPAVARGPTLPLLFASFFRIACVVPTVSWTPTSIVLLWSFSCSAYIKPTYSSVDGPRSTMRVCMCATTPASLVPSTHHSSREHIRSSPPARSLAHTPHAHKSYFRALGRFRHHQLSQGPSRQNEPSLPSHGCGLHVIPPRYHRHDYAPAHTVSFRLVFNAHR
jgi:hypothetical protein